MASINELIRGLNAEDAALFSFMAEQGYNLELEAHKYIWRNYDINEIHGPFDSDEEVIAAARTISQQLKRNIPAAPTSPPTKADSVIKRLTAAPPTPRFSAHEIDLRDHVIEDLESRGKTVERNVETDAGVIEVLLQQSALGVAETTIYEFKCSLTAENVKGVIEQALALRDAFDPTAAVCIVSCCIDDADTDNLDKLKEAAREQGIKANTWDYSVNSDILKIVNPSLARAQEADSPVAAEVAPVQQDAPALPSSNSLFSATETAASILTEQMEPSRASTHPSLLMRAQGLDQEHVAELEATLRAGGTLPPSDIFYDGHNYWVADGNHRHAAALRAGALFDVRVHKGDLRAAIIFALRANAEHGLKLTNDDKRLKAVTLLADPEWFKEGDSVLAGIAGGTVSQPFLLNVRKDLARLIPALSPTENALATDEALAAQVGVNVGLVRVVRRRVSEEQLATLSQNVLTDDGRRRGMDGVVREVREKPAKHEETATPLFPQEESHPESVEAAAAPDTQGSTNASATTAAVSGPNINDLLGVLKPNADGVATDELLRRGFTLEQIQDGQARWLLERDTSGRCFYAWKPADVVEALSEHGSLTRLQLEEMGCQHYAITSALAENAITQPEAGKFALPETDAAATPAQPATSAEIVHALHTGDEETVARAEAAETTPAPQSPAPPAAPSPSLPSDLNDEGWKLEDNSGPVRCIHPEHNLQTTWYDDPAEAFAAARRLQKKHRAERDIEVLLKGRKLVIGLVWIPGLNGKVQVSVTVGDDVQGAARKLLIADDVRPLPEPVMQMITDQLKSQRPAPAQTGAATAPSRKGVSASKAAQKKSPATTKRGTKKAAKKVASKSAKSSSKKPRANA
jgi:hypothetical protein